MAFFFSNQMNYVELEDVRAMIPDTFLTQALDDNSDGVIDAWEIVQLAASEGVDGLLSTRYATPFTSPPKFVKLSARVFAAEICYRRRGTPDAENPYFKQAESLRKLLAQIAAGEIALSADIERQKPSASIITETAKTFSKTGNLSV